MSNHYLNECRIRRTNMAKIIDRLNNLLERVALHRITKEKEKERLVEEKKHQECVNACKDVFLTYWTRFGTRFNGDEWVQILDQKRNILYNLGITKDNIKQYLPDKIAQNEYYVARMFDGPPEFTFNEYYRMNGYQAHYYPYTPESQWPGL